MAANPCATPEADVMLESRYGTARRVLVVDDERQTCEGVARGLELYGFPSRTVTGLSEAEATLRTERPDILVLGIEFPGASGLDLLAGLRGDGDDLPVVMLSGRSTEMDRVACLDMGADDYVVKPFALRELAARLNAVLRRQQGLSTDFDVGRLQIGLSTRDALVDGFPVALTVKEFDLLVALVRAGRNVRSREQLLRQVWGSSAEWQAPATITEHVRRLRAKLAEAGLPKNVVVTVRGVGYQFDATAAV